MVVEQLIRPTGLLDPPIEVRPTKHQIDDLLEEVQLTLDRSERVLVTTLTKRMAEELTKYMTKLDIKVKYIHSEVDTLDRIEILRELREGIIDVLVGVNLLREGLDLPEVSLVAVLDADKEGFLRSNRSLTQTAGRAARNVNGRVIFYADTITDSMQQTMDETGRRRERQMAYNEAHGIVPQQIVKKKTTIFEQNELIDDRRKAYAGPESLNKPSADPVIAHMTDDQLERAIRAAQRGMEKAAKELDFINAARLRDEWQALKVQKESQNQG